MSAKFVNGASAYFLSISPECYLRLHTLPFSAPPPLSLYLSLFESLPPPLSCTSSWFSLNRHIMCADHEVVLQMLVHFVVGSLPFVFSSRIIMTEIKYH